MSIWLVDTGPLVAYLDSSETEHHHVGDIIDGFTGVLATTAAVVTETMHFVSRARYGAIAISEFISHSGMQVHGMCEPADIRAASELMQRYADTPMDFADATLVLLAERLAVPDVLTLDRRGFNTYRLADGTAFNPVIEAFKTA
ncbi:MAG: PIN domain-containing protein [bacterium]|nr:PIN domain-containing protein [bacterium]